MVFNNEGTNCISTANWNIRDKAVCETSKNARVLNVKKHNAKTTLILFRLTEFTLFKFNTFVLDKLLVKILKNTKICFIAT